MEMQIDQSSGAKFVDGEIQDQNMPPKVKHQKNAQFLQEPRYKDYKRNKPIQNHEQQTHIDTEALEAQLQSFKPETEKFKFLTFDNNSLVDHANELITMHHGHSFKTFDQVTKDDYVHACKTLTPIAQAVRMITTAVNDDHAAVFHWNSILQLPIELPIKLDSLLSLVGSFSTTLGYATPRYISSNIRQFLINGIAIATHNHLTRPFEQLFIDQQYQGFPNLWNTLQVQPFNFKNVITPDQARNRDIVNYFTKNLEVPKTVTVTIAGQPRVITLPSNPAQALNVAGIDTTGHLFNKLQLKYANLNAMAQFQALQQLGYNIIIPMTDQQIIDYTMTIIAKCVDILRLKSNDIKLVKLDKQKQGHGVQSVVRLNDIEFQSRLIQQPLDYILAKGLNIGRATDVDWKRPQIVEHTSLQMKRDYLAATITKD